MKRNRKRFQNKKAKSSRYQAKQSRSLGYDVLERRQLLAATTGFDTIGATQSDPAITSALPNTEGDVGPNHFVEFGEQTYTVYNRDGSVAESSTLNEFFVDAGGELFGENVVNPRVIYDRATERWIAAASGDNTGPLAGNWMHIAISETSDPTGQWQQVQFVPTDTGTQLSTEISLGVDEAGVYLAARNVGLDQLGAIDVDPISVSLFSIPKIDLFGPGIPTVLNLTEFADLDPATFGDRIQFASSFEELGDGIIYGFSEFSVASLNSFQISNAGEQTPQAAILSTVSEVGIDAGNNFDPNIFADPMAPPVMGPAFPILQPTTNANGQVVGEEVVQPNGLTSTLIESGGRIFGARTVAYLPNPTADFRANGIHWFELEVDGAGSTPALVSVPGSNLTSHVIADDTNLGDNNGDLVPEYGLVSFFNPSIAYQAETGMVSLVFNGTTQFYGSQTAVGAATIATQGGETQISTYAAVGIRVNNAPDGVDMDGNPIFPTQRIQFDLVDSDGDGDLEPYQILRRSSATDAFNPVGPFNYWGGYSSVRPDPVNPNAFFAAIPFVNQTNDQWDVQVAHITPSQLRPIVEGSDNPDGDLIIIRRWATDTSFIEIEINGIVSDRYLDEITDQIIILAHAGDDHIIIDHSNGDPTPVQGFILDGGSGADTIETNTDENVEFLIDSLNDDVTIPYPAYLATKLLDGRFTPLNDTISADGELANLTLNGEDLSDGEVIRSNIIDIENLISGAGDDSFLFQVGPLEGSATGNDGNDRFVFFGNGSVDGSINGNAGFNTFDVQERNASTNIELFANGQDMGFNGRTINGPVGQFNEVLDQFRDISLIRGSLLNFNDSLQALNSFEATFTVVIPNIDPNDTPSPDDATSFVASTYEANGAKLYFTDFNELIGSVVNDQFNVQSNDVSQLPQMVLNGRTGDDEFNFSSDSPVNVGTTADIGGIFFVEGGGGENTINVSEFSQPDPQDYLVLNARISGPVEVVYTDTNSGNFEVNITGSNTAVDTFFLQSFLANNSLNVFALGGDDIFVIQDLSQAEVNLFGGVGDDTYIIESVGPVDDRDVVISDSIGAEDDLVLIAGTILDEVFIVDIDSFESDQFLFIGIERFGFDGRGGDDEFYVRGISAEFPVVLFGGDGNDIFYLSSDAPTNLGDLTTLNNDLMIDGGSGTNQMMISNENGDALDVVIRNDEITGLFNGTLTYFASDGGVFDSIEIIASNGGNDRFLVESFLGGNTLRIDGRLGEDEFTLGDGVENSSNVVGQVTVDGGSDGDTYNVFLTGNDITNVMIEDSGFSGSDRLVVTGTDEDDTFDLNGNQLLTQVVVFDFSGIIERYTFIGMAGNDTFEIDSDTAEAITMYGNEGNDEFVINDTNAIITALGHEGDDFFDASSLATNSILFDGYLGSDRYYVDFVGAAGRNVNIEDSGTDGGFDETRIAGTDSINVFQIDNDRVSISGESILHNSTIEDVQVNGMGGDDIFNLLESNFTLMLNGQTGNDAFYLSSNAPFQTGDVTTIAGDTLIEGAEGFNQLFVTNFAGSPAEIVVTSDSISGLSGGLISYASSNGVFDRTDGTIGGIVIRGSNDDTSGDLFDIRSLSVGDTIRLVGLDGDDEFSIGNEISGDASFDGGDGSDTYNFEFGSDEPREIVINDSGMTGTDVLNLIGSNDDDNIEISAFGVSDGVSTLSFNIPLSVIEISGLLGDDTFTINGAPTSVVTLYGNSGSDTFIVNSTADIADLNLNGGTQADAFFFNSSYTATRIDALGWLGDDVFTVGQFAEGNLFLDGEGGGDEYNVNFRGSGERRIDTRDSGTSGFDSLFVYGTTDHDRIAVRTTRFLYDDELVIFDENTEGTALSTFEGRDRIVVFGTRSPFLAVSAGMGQDNFIVNGGSRADEIFLFGDEGDDRYVVKKTTVDTTTNLLGGLDNDRFSIGSTMNDDNGNLGLIRGELNVFGGPNSGGGEDQLVANDNGVLAQYSYLVTPTRISAIAGPANLPRDNFAGINYDASTEFLRLDGTPLSNLFEVEASLATRYFINGNAPSNGNADELVVLFQPNDGRNLFVTDAVAGNGFVTFSNGNEMIQFEDIEMPRLDDNSTSLTLPDGFDFGDDEGRDKFFSTADLTEIEDLELPI